MRDQYEDYYRRASEMLRLSFPWVANEGAKPDPKKTVKDLKDLYEYMKQCADREFKRTLQKEGV